EEQRTRFSGLPRWLASAAGLIIFTCSLAGCAMSQEAFERLSAEVSARNELRYRTAEGSLRARGYTFTDDELLYATLDEEARRRCLAATYRAVARSETNEGGADAGETLLMRVAPANRADRPPPVATELHVAEKDACPFFLRRTNELDGRKSDGS